MYLVDGTGGGGERRVRDESTCVKRALMKGYGKTIGL